MSNKYKKYALQKDAQVGEVVMTYGVKFVNNPEHKPHMHAQNRPYLVLHKEESGNFLALKLSSNIRGYMAEFKIFPKTYPENKILTRPTIADVRYITELAPQDIIENGFVLNEQDFNNLFSKIMRMYSINETHISDEHAKIIFKYYIKSRQVTPGAVIKTKYNEDYLLVISEDEKKYTCLPLHRNPTESANNEVNVLKYPSYVNFDEEYIIDKEDAFFIMSFQTDEEMMNYIKSRIKLTKKHILSKEKKNHQ